MVDNDNDMTLRPNSDVGTTLRPNGDVDTTLRSNGDVGTTLRSNDNADMTRRTAGMNYLPFDGSADMTLRSGETKKKASGGDVETC